MTLDSVLPVLQRKPSVSLCDRLAIYFSRRPNQWIQAQELFTVAGSMAWRTRISDARLQYGMRIENRTKRIKTEAGQVTISEYRYVPELSTK